MAKNVRFKLIKGDVAEWLKALVSKTSIGETQSEVQILPSPHLQK